MNKLIRHKNQGIIFIFLIIFLSFLSFYQAFNFSFIIDDWFGLWGVFYDKSIIDYSIKRHHPIGVYEFLLLAPIFSFNSVYYQLVGFVLKIIDSLIAALLIFSITKSKTAGIFSGLIFAASPMGIGTFIRASTHYAALLIPTLCLGLYFWISEKEKLFLYKYPVSVGFIILTIIGSPGAGIVILPVIILWELLNLIQIFGKDSFKNFLFKIITLIMIILLLLWYLGPRIVDRESTLINNLYLIVNNFPEMLTKFLTSIGNLLIGWIMPIAELNNLADANLFTKIAGYSFIIAIFILTPLFLRRKTQFSKIVLFLSIWVLITFLPSWLTQSDYIERQSFTAVSHRYFAVPSIGLIGLIAYLISFARNKYRLPLLIAVIGINLWSSNRILSWQSVYNSNQTQKYLYDRIDQDVPKGDEKNKLFFFTGDHWIRVALEWSGFYPIALRRGITQRSEFSTVTNSLDQVKDLICAKDEEAFPKFKLSNLYGWDVGSGDIYNVSKEVRLIISSEKDCKFNP